ncbi:hypothetical protein UAJ10_18295 [Nitrospirillum sp. BR 11164]|uniref:hypothetical protein n=1 Tax=Nitrospirillum sp. BR 11164 TaxID=3104324 RepID=UPI002AFDF99E|nr:hypothetical protein [Nitrospirillum sp. BR 11164]MEA1650960.1 hypothetical protein [Nitrospirillum sp. BR 11164]
MIISLEDGAELTRCQNEYVEAKKRADALAISKGVDSIEFAEADKVVGALHHRIRELRGEKGKHWME